VDVLGGGPATVAALGLLLGLRHATDADHLVAVTAIVARERTLAGAARIGALWGLGHSATLLAVGGTLVVSRLTMPPRVGLGLELAVALMLVLLGFRNLRHGHTHAPPAPGGEGGHLDAARAVAVGCVHGLAGSAAVALLVLATVRDPRWALAYLAVFGLGTIAGMMAVTALFATPARLAGARIGRFHRGIRVAAGAASLAVGLSLAHEIVVERGMFGAAPSWTPR
jgi:high-affinity nickel-transport protein